MSLNKASALSPIAQSLPDDIDQALLLGRIDRGDGPTPVLLRNGEILDLSAEAPTIADLLNKFEPDFVPAGKRIDSLAGLQLSAAWEVVDRSTRLLAPVDLQCIKAAGVTFAVSTLERVIEERARGDAQGAQGIRAALMQRIGTDLRSVKPGSETAAKLKAALIEDGLWSQYLEVGIGPDAEIFTKAPILSAVGWGEAVGVRSDSSWNNPEPEVVLICDGQGRPRGATLGNDVNLRDIEGRSALLLGKAKDNNASCAIGPFIRLFDAHYTLDDLRASVIRLDVVGEDGFHLKGESSMSQISRDPLDLAGQTMGKHHQYPDGFALFMGTMFAPIEDRDHPGQGFTHKEGDLVSIGTPRLGRLVNKVTTCDQAPPWTQGVGALMRNLAARGLL